MDYDCTRCPQLFPDLASAMKHATSKHGMTRQEAQNERKAHSKRRR